MSRETETSERDQETAREWLKNEEAWAIIEPELALRTMVDSLARFFARARAEGRAEGEKEREKLREALRDIMAHFDKAGIVASETMADWMYQRAEAALSSGGEE